MSEENNATQNQPTGDPPKHRFSPREHPVQVLFDGDTLDTIEETRKYKRPSDGKTVSEPRSTFIYNIVKNHLAEECPNCGGPLTKSCPRCDTEADVIPHE